MGFTKRPAGLDVVVTVRVPAKQELAFSVGVTKNTPGPCVMLKLADVVLAVRVKSGAQEVPVTM